MVLFLFVTVAFLNLFNIYILLGNKGQYSDFIYNYVCNKVQ